MAGIDDWLDLMPQTVTVEPLVSRDAYGAPTYGAPATYQARVYFKTRYVRTAGAEEVVARGRCWIATVAPIDTTARITLPDQSEITGPLILNVDVVPDENGPLYTSIDFA